MLHFSLANSLAVLNENEEALKEYKRSTELDKKEIKYNVEYARMLKVCPMDRLVWVTAAADWRGRPGRRRADCQLFAEGQRAAALSGARAVLVFQAVCCAMCLMTQCSLECTCGPKMSVLRC